MKDGFVKVAAAIPELRVADCVFNADKTIELAKEAAKEGAAVIVFPELGITGYTCQDLFFHNTLLAAAEREAARIAAETKDLESLIFIGLPLYHLGKIYNAATAIYRGRILGLIPKTLIPNYSEFYEARQFTPACSETADIEFAGQTCPFGTKLLFCHTKLKDLIVAAEICEDVWGQNPPSVSHCAAGATLVVNLSASNEVIGKPEYRMSLVKQNSAHNICAYAYTSAGPDESTTDLVFSGHSMICEDGSLIAERKPFAKEKLLFGDVDVQRITYSRAKNNVFVCRENLDYRRIPFGQALAETDLTRTFARRPFVPDDDATRGSRCGLILDMQSAALAKRIKHTGAATAVIGVSGGLDSTLALLVAVRAMEMLSRPASDVLTVTMPCFGTGKRTRSNAEELSLLLGTDFRCIDITASAKQHLEDIGHSLDNYDVTYENAQARERTQVLMDLANQSGGLVIGTGDLSEVALGWSTYNGDHMSMYGVNCSVPKTLVRYIVKYYAETCQNEKLAAVLYDILDTPVSPELVPSKPGEINQRTEEILGNYELHDFFLYHMFRNGYSPDKLFRIARISFAGMYDDEYIKKTLRLFCRRFFAQQFKRSCVPDGVKVGTVALSPRGDWRMSSDSCAAEWLARLD